MVFGRSGYWERSSEIPAKWQRSMLVSIIFAYLIPTAVLWSPYQLTQNATQRLIAYWQLSPIFVNILWVACSTLADNTHHTRSAQGASRNRKSLSRAYQMAAVVAVAVHWLTFWICATSTDPTLSLKFVFRPDFSIAEDVFENIHFIWQWDYFLMSLSAIAMCIQAEIEMVSLNATSTSIYLAVSATLLGSVVLSPGATLALVWWWRENCMQASESGKSK
jgi:hypothetical protein